MARFILQSDYAMQIRTEILRLLTAQTDFYQNAKLVRAENTAIAQIKNRIGARYDCATIFQPLLSPAENGGEQIDTRDQWIVTITIDITLYHLYSQTGSKDVPEHRSQRYQDAIDWLKDVGNGDTPCDLPAIIDPDTEEAVSDVRIWSQNAPNNHKW
ncbi:phage protein Gp36 family protein [Paludibacter sp.]|uniref:phage protein Gp36 family protein n=1 Tax=Paludibacter sp. TaxID=1898105 RepID=UPI001354CF7B|nr:phage protein Gp36 family protein [Paludibacter sp.]MTK53285.1 DUF1320 domain-containing protein [Paludibacter sp.]